MRNLILFAILIVFTPLLRGQTPATAAELSNFTRTTSSADVIQFCETLAKQRPDVVKYSTYGRSHEGKPLPLLTLSKSESAPCVLVYANIHAGEVDGKEAVLALARDKVNDPILDRITLLIAPNINPDGNDKLSDRNRPEQNGPKEVGTRANAQGLDLNRDFVKLESPEIRALVKLFNDRDPLVVVDCHTTNGSRHRYTLTYDGPRYAAADGNLCDYSRSKLLPTVSEAMMQSTPFKTFYYGNFADNASKWLTYPSTPRFGTQYLALRNRIGLLSESYSYAPFEDRVRATRAFVESTLDFTAKHREEIESLVKAASEPRPRVALRTKLAAYESPVTVLGADKEFTIPFVGKSEAIHEVERPEAYVFPRKFESAAWTLARHGIRVEEIREEIKNCEVEAFHINSLSPASRGRARFIDGHPLTLSTDLSPGDWIVHTDQPLGQLAAYLLEPLSEDGLTVWSFFDDGLAVGQKHPVLRVNGAVFSSVAQQPPEERKDKKPITPELLFSGRGFGGFGGAALGAITWLPDGEHWLQVKGTTLQRVNALTGKSEPAFNVEALRKSLATVPGLARSQVDALVRGSGLRTDRDRTGTLIDAQGQTWLAYFDGRPAVQLTSGKGQKEHLTFSPDGKHIAFVRDRNLFIVDVATQTSHQITADTSEEILNGKADWVYYEEIFNRNGQAYWWSPDGSAIAWLRFDDTPVKKFTIADAFPNQGRAETYGYPKPGDPNPTVQLWMAKLDGSAPVQLPIPGKPQDTLIARVGWTPENQVFAYVQNRTQTWLDFTVWIDQQPKVLFRDSTKAWIEDAGEPKYLADGSFLFPSERDGWKHLYHYKPDGTLIRQVTHGEWEVKDVLRVDVKLGGVFVSATYDSPLGSNLLFAKFTGEIEPLTTGGGTHSISMAPSGDLFVDRFSDANTPTKATLRRFSGKTERTLDANPSRDRDEYIFGNYERVGIPVEGATLEGAITYPPDFNPAKKYPVWIMTYAGPHAPTIRDAWGGGRLFEQVLATMGIVVFRVDPRSASGKGAVSAWTCYKRLGVQELKDLEAAADWIAKNSWCDASRIGLSGHSYGGFITAYALTHSNKFSAGIAGAPVTDWRLYDTIYTERYMGLPSENQTGYDETSCIKAAKNLHGKLLLIHGLIDDNVHFQNTMQFADALQRANKPFEIMVYPRARHGIGGRHYLELQIDFIKRTMLR